MRANKKSQITLFMIAGIFILIAFGLIFYAKWLIIDRQSTKLPVEPIIQKAEPTKNYIKECSKDNEKCLLLKLGNISEFRSIEWYNKKSEDFVRNSFLGCVQNLPKEVTQSFDVDIENVNTTATFSDKDTTFLTKNDLGIEIENDTLKNVEVRNSHKVRFRTLHNYTDSILKSPKVRFDYLKDIDVNVKIYRVGDKMQYVLIDPNSTINGREYEFLFVK